jgi:hypothetical protein
MSERTGTRVLLILWPYVLDMPWESVDVEQNEPKQRIFVVLEAVEAPI